MGAGTMLVLVIVSSIVILVSWNIFQNHMIERSNQKEQVRAIYAKLADTLKKLQTLKTTSAQVNCCDRALSLLKQAEQYDVCREVIPRFDEINRTLNKAKLTLPTFGYLEKAKKHRFKQNKNMEKNALLDALYEIRQRGITNDDLTGEYTGADNDSDNVTIEGIENRLSELGWEDK